MTPEFAIKKFKEQIENAQTNELKLWLDVTYTYVEEYFGLLSNQASNFKSLIGDVNIYLIGSSNFKDPIKEINYRNRAIGYLRNYITYITEKEQDSARIQKEVISDFLLSKSIEEKKKTPETQNRQIEKANEPHENQSKMKHSSFTINISILLTVLAGAFLLGLYIGQAKFDKEKIELYDENKSFKNDIETYKIKIDSLNRSNSDLIFKNKELEKNYKTLLLYNSKN